MRMHGSSPHEYMSAWLNHVSKNQRETSSSKTGSKNHGNQHFGFGSPMNFALSKVINNFCFGVDHALARPLALLVSSFRDCFS